MKSPLKRFYTKEIFSFLKTGLKQLFSNNVNFLTQEEIRKFNFFNECFGSRSLLASFCTKT